MSLGKASLSWAWKCQQHDVSLPRRWCCTGSQRCALCKHLPLSLGHPPALPRTKQAGSLPLTPAELPADTLAKMLSRAAAGASSTAKVTEPRAISPSVPVYRRLLCVEHSRPSPPNSRLGQGRGGGKPWGRGERGLGCGVGQGLQEGPNSAPQLAWGLTSAGRSPGMKNGGKRKVEWRGWWGD